MLKGFFDKFRQSAIAKNVMTLSLGTIVSQLIGIVLSPVLARIFSPADYGLWGIFSSTALICAIFMTGRYEVAILRPKEDSDALHLVRLCMLICSGCLLIITLGFCIAKSLGFFPEIGLLFFIGLIIYLLFNSLSQILSYYSNREERYKRIASGTIVKNLVQGASRLAFGFTGLTKFGLIYGAVSGAIANALTLASPLRNIKKIFSSFSFSGVKQQAIKYYRFLLYEMPSAALNTLSTNVPLLLLAFFFSETDIGYFSMAISLMFLPINFITSAQSQVYYKKTTISDDKEIGRLTVKIFLANFLVSGLGLLIIGIFASQIFSIFLGSRWLIAGEYAACFAPWLLMVSCFSPISTIFLLKDKQNQSFGFNLTLFIGRIIAVFVGGLYFKSMIVSMILYGLIGFIIWAVQGIFILRLANSVFTPKSKFYSIGGLTIFILIWLIRIYFILF